MPDIKIKTYQESCISCEWRGRQGPDDRWPWTHVNPIRILYCTEWGLVEEFEESDMVGLDLHCK